MLTTQIVPWDEVRSRWSGPWRELLRTLDVNISLAPEWIESVAIALNRADALRALLAFDGDTLVAAIPFYVTTERMAGITVRVLNLGGNLCSYHHELPARGDHSYLLEQLAKSVGRWDVLRALGITVGGPTDRALTEFARLRSAGLWRTAGDSSPYISIDKSWDEFLQTKTSNFRYNLKRKEKGLLKAGKIELRWYTTPESVPEFLSHMLAIEEHSWKTSEGMAILGDSFEKVYYQHLLPWLAREGLMSANVMLLDGSPIAYSLCYVWNGRHGQLKTSFDDRYKQLSVGRVLYMYTIQPQFAAGAREFDFLGDAMRHKMEWTAQVRAHDDIDLFAPTWRGRIVGFVRRIRHNRGKGAPPAAPVTEDSEEKS